VTSTNDRPRIQSVYVEYDVMEQLRRDLQKSAAEAARVDKNHRNRARRRRAWIRRSARRIARRAALTMRTAAWRASQLTATIIHHSGRLTVAIVQHSGRLTVTIVQHSIRATRFAGVWLLRLAVRSARRSFASPRPRTIIAEERPPSAAPRSVDERPPSAAPGQPSVNNRDIEIGKLDRRQLWLRENSLGRDHPDIALLALIVARRERSRGERLRARFLYERALSISQQNLGAYHPDVIAITSELAELAHESGDLEQAASWESRMAALTGGRPAER
jgi:hypothetical protein